MVIRSSFLLALLVRRRGGCSWNFTATKGASPIESVATFLADLRGSSLPSDPELVPTDAAGSWRDAFRILASTLPGAPSIVVIDELPWLAEQDDLFDGSLQRAWDRLLAGQPVLLLLLGGDVHMMERLTAYETRAARGPSCRGGITSDGGPAGVVSARRPLLFRTITAVRSETIDAWLEHLSARTPTPGGGGAAALLAATAAALIGMVSSYTIGKKWADREAVMAEIAVEAAELRSAALELAEADALAFAEVGASWSMPQGTEAEKQARARAIQDALIAAAVPPARTGKLAVRLVELAQQLAADGNPNVISDVAVAVASATAALESAIVNVEVNAFSIEDPARVAELARVVQEFEAVAERARSAASEVRKGLCR
ncbi:MAG: cyclodeaminase/cyclohydrolase family protein [Pseudonocardia sp.]